MCLDEPDHLQVRESSDEDGEAKKKKKRKKTKKKSDDDMQTDGAQDIEEIAVENDTEEKNGGRGKPTMKAKKGKGKSNAEGGAQKLPVEHELEAVVDAEKAEEAPGGDSGL